MENEKEQELEAQASRVDANLGIDKNQVAQKSMQERVEVEEPKKMTINFTFDALIMILSIVSIVFAIFAKLFAVVTVVVAFQVFYWLGAIALFGALAVFAVQMFKDKKASFNPTLVMLVLAVLACTFVVIV